MFVENSRSRHIRCGYLGKCGRIGRPVTETGAQVGNRGMGCEAGGEHEPGKTKENRRVDLEADG